MTQENMGQSVPQTKNGVKFTESLLWFWYPTCHDLKINE